MEYRGLDFFDGGNPPLFSRHKWVIDTGTPGAETVTRDGVEWKEVYGIEMSYDAERRATRLVLDCYVTSPLDTPAPTKGLGAVSVRNDDPNRRWEVIRDGERIEEAVGFELRADTGYYPVQMARITVLANVEWRCSYGNTQEA